MRRLQVWRPSGATELGGAECKYARTALATSVGNESRRYMLVSCLMARHTGYREPAGFMARRRVVSCFRIQRYRAYSSIHAQRLAAAREASVIS